MKSLAKLVLIPSALALGLSQFAAAQDSSEQYQACQSIIKQALGEESIVKVKSAKTRSGVTTIKLQVVPPQGGRSVMRCVNDTNEGSNVTVLDKDGNQL